jgi:tRNA-splicing ligase RtcB
MRAAARLAELIVSSPPPVVTKIDPTRVRRAIAVEHLRTLMEEAPSQYKSVTPVVETVADAGIASPVARLRPLLTVKG